MEVLLNADPQAEFEGAKMSAIVFLNRYIKQENNGNFGKVGYILRNFRNRRHIFIHHILIHCETKLFVII